MQRIWGFISEAIDLLPNKVNREVLAWQSNATRMRQAEVYGCPPPRCDEEK
jgi:hypothetical protein